MNRLLLNIVDVFAEEKYAGNQLAVVRYGEDISGVVMQKIARETNYSETTFISSAEEREGGFDVRIFTPARELPFAGHPTLGTAYVIAHEVLGRAVEKVVLNLKVGQVPVTFSQDGILWMRHKEPTFGNIHDAETLSQVLGIETSAIDTRFPIQEVSTGLPFIIVPLRKLEHVKHCSPVKDRFWTLVDKMDAKSILVFNPETYDPKNNLNVRVFAEAYGVFEDPATGSANGCLAAYLSRHQYFGSEQVSARVEQGYEIGRPSLLHLTVEHEDGSIAVYVGGRVIPVAKGELL